MTHWSQPDQRAGVGPASLTEGYMAALAGTPLAWDIPLRKEELPSGGPGISQGPQRDPRLGT